jgi:hypothetical protein
MLFDETDQMCRRDLSSRADCPVRTDRAHGRSSISATTTLASCAAIVRAVARPIPIPAPVIRATFPSSRAMLSPPQWLTGQFAGARDLSITSPLTQ